MKKELTLTNEEPKLRVKKMKIKDLPQDTNLRGVKFRDPKTKTTGYWYSQWGYDDGKAGVWWKRDMASGQIFPLFLDNLREALEFEVIQPKGA
jgi:hypothetical protein